MKYKIIERHAVSIGYILCRKRLTVTPWFANLYNGCNSGTVHFRKMVFICFLIRILRSIWWYNQFFILTKFNFFDYGGQRCLGALWALVIKKIPVLSNSPLSNWPKSLDKIKFPLIPNWARLVAWGISWVFRWDLGLISLVIFKN